MYDIFGGAKGIRTPDLLNAIQTRYQLRHDPTSFSLFCSHILQHFHDIDKRFFATFVSPWIIAQNFVLRKDYK